MPKAPSCVSISIQLSGLPFVRSIVSNSKNDGLLEVVLWLGVGHALLFSSYCATVRAPCENGSVRFRTPKNTRNLFGKGERPKWILRLNVTHFEDLIFEATGYHIADADG